jgi:hypothetical protein
MLLLLGAQRAIEKAQENHGEKFLNHQARKGTIRKIEK